MVHQVQVHSKLIPQLCVDQTEAWKDTFYWSRTGWAWQQTNHEVSQVLDLWHLADYMEPHGLCFTSSYVIRNGATRPQGGFRCLPLTFISNSREIHCSECRAGWLVGLEEVSITCHQHWTVNIFGVIFRKFIMSIWFHFLCYLSFLLRRKEILCLFLKIRRKLVNCLMIEKVTYVWEWMYVMLMLSEVTQCMWRRYTSTSPGNAVQTTHCRSQGTVIEASS